MKTNTERPQKTGNAGISSYSLLILRIVIAAILLFNVAFYVYNTTLPGPASNNISIYFTRMVNIILSRMGSHFFFTHLFMRKLAHIVAYASMTFWLLLLVFVSSSSPKRYRIPLAALGVAVPVIDEVQQHLFSGRSGRLTDVLIDYGGILAGLLCALALRYIVLHYRRERSG